MICLRWSEIPALCKILETFPYISGLKERDFAVLLPVILPQVMPCEGASKASQAAQHEFPAWKPQYLKVERDVSQSSELNHSKLAVF